MLIKPFEDDLNYDKLIEPKSLHIKKKHVTTYLILYIHAYVVMYEL